MSGFITMERDALDHPLLQDAERFRAWFWMVARACWKPTRFDVSGKIITLQRGQFCCSVRELAETWGWSKSAVDRFLTRLKTETMIGTDAGTGRLIITICNYAKYQDRGESAGTGGGTPTGTVAGQQRDIKEQGNKETRDKEPNGSSSNAGACERAGDDLFDASQPEPVAPPAKPKAVKAKRVAMTEDWVPGPLPDSVAALVSLWPPGRLQREIEHFRDYWIDRGERRPGWDRTFHNRIRDIHDRVMRDYNNGNRNNQAAGRAPSGDRGHFDRRDSFTREIDRAAGLDGPHEPAVAFGRHDAGDVAGGGEFPLARRPALR